MIVLGGGGTMLFAARFQQEKAADSQVLSQAAVGEKSPISVKNTIIPDPAVEADMFDFKTGFAANPSANPSAKPTLKPSPLTALPSGKFLPADAGSSEAPRPQSSDSDKRDSAQGPVYTWYDGDRTMQAVLQNDLVVQETSANTDDDDIVVSRGQQSVVRKRLGQGANVQPVFKSASGDGLMTLPGGVLLALDPNWDESQLEEFFADNQISQDSVLELDFMDNGFLVDTEEGFPALDLANQLANQEGVVTASPNWARERETR